MVNVLIGLTLAVFIMVIFCVCIANLLVNAMPVTFLDDEE